MRRIIAFILLGYLPILGGLTTDPGPWYDGLEKAPFHPPGWIFGPVWMVLYLLIGLGLERWHRQRGGFGAGWWTVIACHHLLNAAWTPLFFGLQQPAWALVDILLLAGLIAIICRNMAGRSRIALACFLPYAGWVGFAALLNAWIVWAN